MQVCEKLLIKESETVTRETQECRPATTKEEVDGASALGVLFLIPIIFILAGGLALKPVGKE